MRSRRPAPDEVADVARRRLELLSAELAGIRLEPPGPPSSDGAGPELTPADPGSGPSAGDRDGPGALPAQAGPVPLGDSRADRSPDAPGERTPGRHAHRPLGPAASAARWVEDRLPASLQGRVRLTGSHLAVVALTLVAGLALTVWWVTRADGDVTAVPALPAVGSPTVAGSGPLAGAAPPTAVGSGVAPGGTPAPGQPVAPVGSTASSAAPTASGSASSIVVDVAGKVRRPGIATLPTGSRVVDAIQAAGGAKHGVRLGTLNLARVLADGEQVVVGLPAPTGVAAPAASSPTTGAAIPMVDVNTATESQLEELPGVGPVTAQAILDYRTQNGAFASVDALLEVSGIGDATLAKIAPYVTL